MKVVNILEGEKTNKTLVFRILRDGHTDIKLSSRKFARNQFESVFYF